MAQTPSDDRISISKQTDDRKFVGTFAPVELHDLVESGEIPVQAAWLAMVINSLSKGKKNKRRWCYAGNEYLGNKMHRSSDTVQGLLQALETAGMLVSKFSGRLRLLRIDYGGLTEKKRAKTYLKEEREAVKIPGIPCKNTGSDPVKNPARVYIEEKGKKTPVGDGFAVQANGQLRKKGIRPDQEHVDAHAQLRKALKSNHRRFKERPGSIQAYQYLVEKDGIDYHRDLDWYCLNCDEETQDRLGLPDIESSIDFCSKITWVSRCRRKATGATEKAKRSNELPKHKQWC